MSRLKLLKFYINGNIAVERSDFVIKNRPLRLNESFKYEFPNIIEIKLTDRCSYECLLCPEQSKSGGINNFQKDRLFKVLSELPKLPLLFILSGGNLLEIISGVCEVELFLRSTFKDCSIIVNLNSLDRNRVENLPHSFGGKEINKFIENTSFFSISLGQYYDSSLLNTSFFGGFSNFNRLLSSDLIFRLTYGSQIDKIIEDNENGYNNNSFIVSDDVVYKNKEIVLDTIEKLNLYHVSRSRLYFSSSSLKYLGITDNSYNLGWDGGYIYIDAVNGKYSIDRKNKINWDNIKSLEFYDTYNK